MMLGAGLAAPAQASTMLQQEIISANELKRYLNPYEQEHQQRAQRLSVDGLGTMIRGLLAPERNSPPASQAAQDKREQEDTTQTGFMPRQPHPRMQESSVVSKPKSQRLPNDADHPRVPGAPLSLSPSSSAPSSVTVGVVDPNPSEVPTRPLRSSKVHVGSYAPAPQDTTVAQKKAPSSAPKRTSLNPLKVLNPFKKTRSQPDAQATPNTKAAVDPADAHSSALYYAPPRQQGTRDRVQSMTGVDNPKWGIRIGTWAKAQLQRDVSNADQSAIEIYLQESIVGSRRSIPQGTILFGRPSFNLGLRRLNIRIFRGIAPDGTEFSLQATVFSEDKLAGLTGVVERNRAAELQEELSRGALDASKLLVNELIGGDQISQGFLEGAAGGLLNREKALIQQVDWTIHVAAQEVLIRVDKSF